MKGILATLLLLPFIAACGSVGPPRPPAPVAQNPTPGGHGGAP
jgi:hypothetical protein